MIEIQKIEYSDAQKLSDLATKSYFQHYPDYWYDGGSWYAEKSFNLIQLQNEIVDTENLFYFAKINENPVGFIKIRPNQSLKNYAKNGFELERIYLLKEVQGMGVGKKLMDFSIEMAKKQGKDYIWLRTMDSSLAFEFYKKNGFRDLPKRKN